MTERRGRSVAALSTSDHPLTEDHDVAMLDLDGVVYVGPRAVPGVVGELTLARDAGMRLAYVTNNASRTPAEVAAHLRDLGLPAEDHEVVTSAQAAARLVAAMVPPGSAVLVVGGKGLVSALAEHSLRAVASTDANPAAVVQGFHPDIGWRLLAEGSYAVASGLPWVACNADRTMPTARGTAPGNGTLVAAIAEATGCSPVVAGKPETALFDETVQRVGGRTPLVVGDRLDTDIEGANRVGADSLLVLTGVTALSGVAGAPPALRPTFVAPGLEALRLPQPRCEARVDGGVVTVRCGDWTVRLDRGCAKINGPSGQIEPEAGRIQLVRATVAAAWKLAGERPGTAGDRLDLKAVERVLDVS